ncbi:MAG: hypothetical protein NT069_30265 [Planctomycetota bacterium]|nr:hypothetical protein [Planctomycetota bacterium]
MVKGRAQLEWNQTALIVSYLHNAQCTDETKLTTAADFFPKWLRKPKSDRHQSDAIPVNDITLLKAMIPPQNPASVR